MLTSYNGTFNVNGSIEVAFDLKGHIQIIGSGSFDVSTAGIFSLLGGVTGSAYLMPDTSYLAGDTYYVGGGAYVPITAVVSAGGSGNIGQTSDGYWGVNASGGVGTITAVGAEFHAGYANTQAFTKQINIFEGMGKILESIWPF